MTTRRAILAGLMISLWGCGTHEYRYERYSSRGSGYTKGENNAWLMLDPESNEKEIRKGHTRHTRTAPYTLRFHVHAKEDFDAPVKLLEARIEHEGETVVVHEGSDAPLEMLLEKPPDEQYWEAVIRIPLGDRLMWVNETMVVVTAVVEVPWQDEPLTIETQFKGHLFEDTGHDMDFILSA